MDTHKHIIVMIDSAILILFILYIWNFITFMFAEAPAVSQIGFMVGYCVLLFGVLLSAATYLVFLKKVLRGLPYVMAPLVIGAAVTQFLILYDTKFLATSDVGRFCSFILVIWLWLRGYYCSEFFSSRFPLPEHEIAKMVTSFPPHRFSDMWPFHCYMVFLLVLMPNIVRIAWQGI